MILILYAFIYIMIGAILLGVMSKLYCSNKKTKEFFDYMNLDIVGGSTDSYVGWCFTFAVFWPLVCVMLSLIFPFVYIKFMTDKRWKNKKH